MSNLTSGKQKIPYSINPLRHDWTRREILALFKNPMNDLLFEAHTHHRENFDANTIQLSVLLNIKSGGCSEDCAYCGQSARHKTGTDTTAMMSVNEVVRMAKQARDNGASRFCMGAAWREAREQDLDKVIEMVREIKKLGLETCTTLGMLSQDQATRLKGAGLDYYNHNLDTSAAYYKEIVSTHEYEDRLRTLEHIRKAGIHVCCGGIVGMGESEVDRAEMLLTLANMPKHPESVPINMLIQIEGTPLSDIGRMDPFEFVRTVAIARILMPASYIRLSAGREQMSDEMQALCFFAGANSIFYGDRLLTTDNPDVEHDQLLFQRLGLKALA
jgi:biotin synthase